MRNALLAGGLALLSLIAPSCVDTAIIDEVAAGSEEDAPDQLDVKLQDAAAATPTSAGPASRSRGTAAATLVGTDADTDEDSEDGDGNEDGEDGDSSSVSGSGDGRVIVKK